MSKKILLSIFAIGCGTLAFFSFKDSLRTYVPFSEAITIKRAVQILGTLDKKEAIQHKDGYYTLLLKDKDGTVLPVRHRGIKPVNIEHADSIVAQGFFNVESGYFEADKILVKCPSRYAKKTTSAESEANK